MELHGKSGSALPTALSHRGRPLERAGAHHLLWCGSTRAGSLPPPLRGDQEQPGPGARPSLEETRRPGGGTRLAPPGRWRPQGPPSRALRSGVAATVPKAPAARQAGLFPRGQRRRGSGGKDPRRSLLPLRVHPSPLPTPDPEKDTHTKTFATLLIYSRFLPLSQWATSCRTPE